MSQFDLLLTQNVHASGIEYSEKIVNLPKGALLTADAAQTPTVLNHPAANDYHLVTDTSVATGLKWIPVAAGHTQNTDTGTTSPTFTINSGSVLGKIILQAVNGVSNFALTLSNSALTADRTISFPDLTGTVALTQNKLSVFAATTSAELAGVISDETGTGVLVFNNAPSLTNPKTDNIVATVAGATADLWSEITTGSITIGAGLTTGTINIASVGTGATTINIGHTNATINLVGAIDIPIVSAVALGTNASGVIAAASTSGTGSTIALTTSPVFVTPTLGAATATTINKVTITAPATGATLTIANGKTLTVNNTLTFTGTDSASVAFGAGGTVAYTSGTLAQFGATTSAQLAGVITDEVGYTTGALLVFNTSPTFVTSVLANSTTFAVFDTVATEINAFGAAGILNLGYDGTGAGTTSIANGATATGITNTINIGSVGAAGSTTNVNIGSAAGGTVTVGKDLVVGGNLTVNGTVTTVNTETIALADNIIVLNSNYVGGTPTENGGIEVERGTITNASLIWDEAVDKWKAGLTGAEVEISLLGHTHTGVYQPLDADLTAIAALAGTSGVLRKTAADTWTLDTSTYLENNQTITLTDQASGSGTTSIAVTLNNAAVIAKVLTGYVSTNGAIAATDSILAAIQKLGYDKHVAVTMGTANGLSLAGQALSLALSSTSTTGALSSTDWNTFSGKMDNWVTAPAAKTSTGTTGQKAYDGNFIYVCTATNTWKRSALATNW